MNIAKPVTFAASLAALALIMATGERLGDPCLRDLTMEKSRQIIEKAAGVVDIAWTDVEPTGCRLGMRGFADVKTAGGFGRRQFEIVVAYDQQTQTWQQISFNMP